MAMVTFLLPGGGEQTVPHGGIIGRLATAALVLDDARVSEAHAMVSLRGADLKLLALRGRFAVKQKQLASVVLTPGLVLEMAPGLLLTVGAVDLPERVMALRGGFGSRVLMGVTSLFDRGNIQMEHGWQPDADAVLWTRAGIWRTDQGELTPGQPFAVGTHQVSLEWVKAIGGVATQCPPEFSVPLVVVVRFDTVHLLRKGLETVVIRGHAARVITDLALSNSALPWLDLAVGLWGEIDRSILRGRWDMMMTRLRRQLQTKQIRRDLVRSAGNGLAELVLASGDRVVDEA